MEISKLGLDLIKKYESWRDKSYRCAAGKITIGFGHVILPCEKFEEPISKEVGEQLLRKDAEKATERIIRFVTAPINENQAAALLSFVFNIGVGAFAVSTLLKCLNKEKYNLAADQFGRWVYGTVKGQKVRLAGLVKRRAEEKELFLTTEV